MFVFLIIIIVTYHHSVHSQKGQELRLRSHKCDRLTDAFTLTLGSTDLQEFLSTLQDVQVPFWDVV
jgi:hypothetical protein